MVAKAWISAIGSLVVVGACITVEVPTATAQNGFQCSPRFGQEIHITVGDIDCVTASGVAAQYDLSGDKFQTIGPFICYSANEMTAPLLFQCVADNAEFGVYPA